MMCSLKRAPQLLNVWTYIYLHTLSYQLQKMNSLSGIPFRLPVSNINHNGRKNINRIDDVSGLNSWLLLMVLKADGWQKRIQEFCRLSAGVYAVNTRFYFCKVFAGVTLWLLHLGFGWTALNNNPFHEK